MTSLAIRCLFATKGPKGPELVPSFSLIAGHPSKLNVALEGGALIYFSSVLIVMIYDLIFSSFYGALREIYYFKGTAWASALNSFQPIGLIISG